MNAINKAPATATSALFSRRIDRRIPVMDFLVFT
jgi:hypothetical protein